MAPKSRAARSALTEICSGFGFVQAQALDFVFADQQRDETFNVSVSNCRDHFGRNLFGGNLFPAVDLSIFVFVQSPASAAGIEPAVLVCFAIEVFIDVAIDFDAVFESRPTGRFSCHRWCRRIDAALHRRARVIQTLASP